LKNEILFLPFFLLVPRQSVLFRFSFVI
jgi:hypothetical protein